jgi:FkbH-like protein
MAKIELSWLPVNPRWIETVAALEAADAVSFKPLVALANSRIDFLRTERLDRLLRKHFATPPSDLPTKPVRLAVLGSSTLTHLLSGIRIAALRRGLWVEIYEGDYGGYYQEFLDPNSGLHAFRPNIVLISLDAEHVAGSNGPDIMARLEQCWRTAQQSFQAAIIQQTVLPTCLPILGSNEHRLENSPATLIDAFNAQLRERTRVSEVHLLSVDARAAQDGVRAWHDPMPWHRAKQDISPAAAPVYGDLVARIIAALQGRSAKCLVLDLDNTLWGGVVGDDGLEGIVLGQGSAEGEAFVAVQRYAVQLAQRGVIVAVCSKNDERNAMEPFEKHPEMLLKPEHIASFVANWDDKATNIRRIAHNLNIGLDSLVFVDDNPFERTLVREQLPEVAVPEIPDDDPAAIPLILADAGYFESLAVTAEDRDRTAQYRANQERAALEQSAVDLPSYLRSLDMQLIAKPFDEVSLNRVGQLINKTNQFNLRTQRYTTEAVRAVMNDPAAFGLQFRLLDRFGDNGIIAIVIGKIDDTSTCFIDTWLMSCRVLGRQVEQATLNVVAQRAARLGARRMVGEYIPTAKNAMVADHFARLGFAPVGDDQRVYGLDLAEFTPGEVVMQVMAP